MTGTTDWLPLTAGQADFWQEFLFHPDQPVSTVAHCLRLAGPVDEPALARAITRTVAESDALALRFRPLDDGRVLQRVDPAAAPRLLCHDLRGEPAPGEAAQRIMRADMDAVLDLRRDPLSAQMLLRLGDREWLWYCRGHHIILDGYGMSLIEGRVAELYNAATAGGAPGQPLSPLAPFLAEEAEYAVSPRHAADRAYWADYLEGRRAALPVLARGTEDYGTAPLQTGFVPGDDFERRLGAAAEAVGLHWGDLLALLSAAWLATADPLRPGGEAPLAVWLPYMSRMGSVSARVPAMVVNIIPLLVRPEPGEDLAALLGRLAATLRRHRRHGRYRVEELARDCGLPEGQRFHFTPLVNVMPFAPPRFAGLEARRRVLAAGPGDGFNLTFTADGLGRGLACGIEAECGPWGRDFDARARAFEDWLRATVATLAEGGQVILGAAGESLHTAREAAGT